MCETASDFTMPSLSPLTLRTTFHPGHFATDPAWNRQLQQHCLTFPCFIHYPRCTCNSRTVSGNNVLLFKAVPWSSTVQYLEHSAAGLKLGCNLKFPQVKRNQ